jgi:hypothetical protein
VDQHQLRGPVRPERHRVPAAGEGQGVHAPGWHRDIVACQLEEMLTVSYVCQICHMYPFTNTLALAKLMPFPADPAGGRAVLHELLVQGVPGLQLITVLCAPPLFANDAPALEASAQQPVTRAHRFRTQDVPKTQAHAPFVNHWAACQMCTESIPMRIADGGADNSW